MDKSLYKKFIEEFKSGKIKISIKFLKMKIGCNEKNRREICYGFCCRNLSPYYTKTLIDGENIPKEYKKFFVDGVMHQNYDDCKMLEYCVKDGSQKPIECKLAPLGFNESGRLIVKRWTWRKPCPLYGIGNEIYKELKDNLIDIFGEKCYNKICYMVENNIEEL